MTFVNYLNHYWHKRQPNGVAIKLHRTHIEKRDRPEMAIALPNLILAGQFSSVIGRSWRDRTVKQT